MKKRNSQQIRFSFIPLLTLISLTILYQPLLAQSRRYSNVNSNNIPIQFNQKQQSGSDRGRPSKRRGMASRNDCPSTNIPLTALIPENNISQVAEANPTFWLFIPYPASRIPVGEFVLQDEANNDVYRSNFSIEKGEGIVGITLKSGITLEFNKVYQWYFKLSCNQEKLSSPIYVHGWIRRVELQPKQQQQLKLATSSRQRVAFYAKNGIWYSAFNELAKLRQANPNDQMITRDWLQLLNDIGLQDLSQQPVIGNLN